MSNSSASRNLEEVHLIKDFICFRRQLKCYQEIELPDSISQEAPPSSQEAPPSSQEAPPSSQEAPPTSQEAPPTSQEAPPTSQETHPASQEAHPASQNNSESDPFLPVDGSSSENTHQELPGASSRGSTPPPSYGETMRIIELESASSPVSLNGNYFQLDAEFIKRMLNRSSEYQSAFSRDFQEQQPVMSYLNFVSPQNFEMRSLDGTGAGPSNSQSAGTSTDPRN